MAESLRDEISNRLATTIVSPKIFDRKLYEPSEEMKEAFSEYGLAPRDVELVIGLIGFALQGGGMNIIQDSLAKSVHVKIGEGKKMILSPEKAVQEFSRLNSIPEFLGSLYDESQIILSSEAIGLANGTIWIAFKCTDKECTSYEIQITTLNLRH